MIAIKLVELSMCYPSMKADRLGAKLAATGIQNKYHVITVKKLPSSALGTCKLYIEMQNEEKFEQLACKKIVN